MIYFVRHGESEANLKGIFAGQRVNSILTKKGREQAKNTAQKIIKEKIKINKVVSSPLKRAKETAQIIADELGLDVIIDKRITEYDMGILSGAPLGVISSAILTKAEKAEHTRSFNKRVFSCVKELASEDGNILIVSHAGVARMLETARKKIKANLFYDMKLYPNGSITKIDWIK